MRISKRGHNNGRLSQGLVAGAIRAMAVQHEWRKAEELFNSILLTPDTDAKSMTEGAEFNASVVRTKANPSRAVLSALAECYACCGQDARLLTFLRDLRASIGLGEAESFDKICDDGNSDDGHDSNDDQGTELGFATEGLRTPVLDPLRGEIVFEALARLIENETITEAEASELRNTLFREQGVDNKDGGRSLHAKGR